MTNRLPWLALALAAFAAPAMAQPATIGKVERFLNWIERRPLFSAQPGEGFVVRIGIDRATAVE